MVVRTLIFMFGLMAPLSVAAQGASEKVDAVVEIYADKLDIFSDLEGSKKVAEIQRSDVKLPAAQISRESDYGLIKVEFRYVGSTEKALIGWVDRGLVETEKRSALDVVSNCARNLDAQANSTRGTRALGGKC